MVADSNVDAIGSGRVMRTLASGQEFAIHVSPFQLDECRRLTIAREIGHLFLHMGYWSSDEWWKDAERYYRRGLEEGENEAHEFAAAFLMPEREYRAWLVRHADLRAGG